MVQWTSVPSRLSSFLAPSVSGTSFDSDQDKVLAEDESLNELMNVIFSVT